MAMDNYDQAMMADHKLKLRLIMAVISIARRKNG